MLVTLKHAITLLKAQEVVALPTETVYGLAAALHSLKAVKRVFQIKKRPLKNPLIIHLGKKASLLDYASSYPPETFNLIEVFWPGPLTLILPANPSKIDSSIRSGLETAAFRMPDHPLTLAILEEIPALVMPSANLSGKPSPTKAEHVLKDLGENIPVVNGGMCKKGLESTILSHIDNKWWILRLGSLPASVFKPILGYEPKVFALQSSDPMCPGQYLRHYAPEAKLILGDANRLEEADAILGFYEGSYPANKKVYYLGSLETPEEVAHHFYDVLRQLDVFQLKTVFVDVNFPREGIWQTIWERLVRASNNIISEK